MTEDDAKEMLALLASVFRMRRPRLVWSTRTRRGWAYPTLGYIKIGPRCRQGGEASLVHEVAHLLAHKEYGRRRRGWRTDWHGPHFVDCLARVAEAWYGNTDRYPWHTEYRSIAKVAMGMCY